MTGLNLSEPVDGKELKDGWKERGFTWILEQDLRLVSKFGNNVITRVKTKEWYIEWQQVVQQVTKNDNKWKQMTMSGTTSKN